MSKSKKDGYYRHLSLAEITSDRLRKWHYQQLIEEEEATAKTYERCAQARREAVAEWRETMNVPWSEWKAKADDTLRMKFFGTSRRCGSDAKAVNG